MCRNITTLDACRRTDPLARRVCDWKQGLFCLSTRASSNASVYEYFPAAVRSIVSRNKVEESRDGFTACLNETTETYQLCDPSIAGNNTSPNFNCTDLFYSGCNSCQLRSGTGSNTNAPRYITGEICGTLPTLTTTTLVTETVATTSGLKEGLAIGFGSSFGVIVLAAAIAAIVFIARRRNSRTPF